MIASDSQKPEFRVPVVRRILREAFSDPELNAFCQDHFPEGYDDLGPGQEKGEKITMLIDRCRSDIAKQKLLNLLSTEAKDVYDEYRDRLH